MISVDEAVDLIMAQIPAQEIQTLALGDCPGRVLAEEIQADRDQPPFDRVAMDGIGVSWEDLSTGQQTFQITGVQQAGRPALNRKGKGTALEVTTGAILPNGCDTVIPYEDLKITDGKATLVPRGELKKAGNIHFQGSDYKKGQVLLTPGCLIRSVHLHTLATVGKTKVKVRARARVAIAATGDELVPIQTNPLDYQIRRSNAPAILAEAGAWGFRSITDVHLPDDEFLLTQGLRELLQENQVIILSGGVSMGNFDFVPKVLKALGCQEIFHKVRQKPGKPLWFGTGPQGQRVFGLPGNPVSSLFSFRRYVIPFIMAWEGRSPGNLRIPVPQMPPFKPGSTHFIPVAGNRPLDVQGSGNFHQLAESTGFIQINEDFVPNRDKEVPYFPWGGLGEIL